MDLLLIDSFFLYMGYVTLKSDVGDDVANNITATTSTSIFLECYGQCI